MERISTGIRALDELLHGGFPAGATILIAGRPGSGKTIMANQMMFYNATTDHKVIYLTTLAEPQVKVMKFQQEFTYFDLSKFQRTVLYQDLGGILRRSGPTRALSVIDELLQVHQPKMLVIDTIKTLADMFPSLTEYREFLTDVSLRLATWGCTTLILGEYSEEEIDIRPESALVDGIIYLSGTEEKGQQKRYLRILKMRGTGHVGGEIVFSIADHGIELFPRLKPIVTARSSQYYEDRITTGLTGLDEMMHGGIPRGSATLLSGASGTGKTLISLHFAHTGLQHGEKVVFVTYEETPQQLIVGAARLGLDFAPYLASGQLHLLHISPMELDVDEHIYHIQTLVAKAGAQRLVIDSISSFELGMQDKIKYTNYIWALTDYFKSIYVSTLLTHELHDSEMISKITKHAISFIADNLLVIRYLEQDLEIKRYLRVVKMRSSGHSTRLWELHVVNGRLSLEETPAGG